MRRLQPATRSPDWSSRLKRVVMGSGWRVGCAVERSKRMAFIRPAFRSPGSGDARRPIGWILGLLKRSLLGWLRGEKKHASMAAIPTLEEEDAKRPTRDREQLVGNGNGIVNRMKAALVRLGIRGFNPKLRKAPERLATLRTPEGCLIPPNTLAELTREMAHLRFINDQIKQIEVERLRQLKHAPQQGSNA